MDYGQRNANADLPWGPNPNLGRPPPPAAVRVGRAGDAGDVGDGGDGPPPGNAARPWDESRRPMPSVRRAFHRSFVFDVPSPQAAGQPILSNIGEWCAPGCDTDAAEETCPTVAVSVRVDLQNQGDAVDPTLDYSDAFLRFHYGSGPIGTESILDMDLMVGAAVPLVADSFFMEIVYPLRTSTQQVPILQPALKLWVSVGEGAYGSSGTRAARRTINLGSVNANTESAVGRIPPFATSVVYANATIAEATATLKQFGSVNAAGFLLSSQLLAKPEYQSVAVRTGALGFTLTPGNANVARCSAIFLLGGA